MKRIIFVGLVLAFGLAACAPAAPASVATNAPVVAATDAIVSTAEPAAQANNTNTPVPVGQTEIAEPTLPPPPPPPKNPNPPPGSVFVDARRSRDAFALRCSPSDITFNVKTTNPLVASVDFYYRIQNKAPGAGAGVWRNGGQMDNDGQGNFSLTFASTKIDTESLPPSSQKSWFDYQFVGLSKYGDVIGRSERFTQKITYTTDCP